MGNAVQERQWYGMVCPLVAIKGTPADDRDIKSVHH